jgi:hypothetical protein
MPICKLKRLGYFLYLCYYIFSFDSILADSSTFSKVTHVVALDTIRLP